MAKVFNGRFWLPVLLIILILLNWAASQFHVRVDLTNEKRFTLSSATKKLLVKLDAPVSIDVFLKGNYPSGFRQLSSSTKDILKEFKEVAGNKIQYNFISPDEVMPGTEVSYSDTLSTMGMIPINLTSQLKEGQKQQNVYPFALVHYNDKTIPVELYKGKTPLMSYSDINSAEALLEYRLAEAVAKISEKEKPAVAYAVGNGEPTDYSTYDLSENVLNKNYRFAPLDLTQSQNIPLIIKLIIIVKPKTFFTDEQKLKLDQYVMNGGKLLVFADRLNAEMDSLQIKNEVTAFDRDLKWNDLFFNYGVRINADLLMDLQCDYLPFDVNGNGQFELLPWNYFPVMESKSNHPINKGLGFVAGRFVNSLDTVEAEGITKTVLLSSSANARTIGAPAVISGAENVNAPEDAKYKKNNVPVAVLLEGKFNSMFANRLSLAMVDTLKKNGDTFKAQCTSDNKIIVVGDGDMVLNSIVKGNPIPMGMNVYTYGTQAQVPFANKDFLQNCISYLINENGLSEAKAKDYVVRLLDNKKTAEQKTTWQVVNIAFPVILILMFAFIFQWLRRRKFTK